MYIILLYDNEQRWKNYHTKEWSHELNDECNQKAIEQSFEPNSKGRKKKIQIETFGVDMLNPDLVQMQDEQESIDLILQQSIYNRYIARGEKGTRSEDIVTAYPVAYNGGYFSFNTETHKFIVVTDIIEGRNENIRNTEIKALKVGDLVVLRESPKDIVRDVADSILKESKMTNQRVISNRWRQALLLQNVFYDRETIIDMIQQEGCNKDRQTIRNWMINDNMIIPRSRKDIEIIAKVTGDKELKNSIDEVIAAAKIVNRAHIKAGKTLSLMLKSKIVNILAQGTEIDTRSILDPIELQIDNIGTVKLLRIIDIGTPLNVSSINTNRLFSDESEAILWQ